MKKLLTTLLLIAVSGCLLAQKIKVKTETLNIFDEKGKELLLPPIIRQLESDEKYVFLYPDFAKSTVSLVETSEYPLKDVGTIITKKEKDEFGPNGYKADIKFKYVSEGITNLTSSYVEHNYQYIVKITFSFPFSLQILSADDELIKEIVIANESDVTTVYASVDSPSIGASTIDYDKMKLYNSAKDIKTGYKSPEHLDTYYQRRKNSFLSNIRSEEWGKNVRRAKKCIYNLYSAQSPSGTFSIIQLGDKSKKDFSEITQKVEEFKKALIAWSADPLNDNLINRISDFAEYFNSEGDKAAANMALDTGARQTLEALLQNNAALAYAIAGDFDASKKSFAKTEAISAFSKARNFTVYYRNFAELRALLQTNETTINVSAIIDK